MKQKIKYGVQLFTAWLAVFLGFNCMVFAVLGPLSFGLDPFMCLGLGLFGFVEYLYARQFKIAVEEEAAAINRSESD